MKRRKTVRAALVYMAAAYAVLEGAELLLPAVGAPDWAFRALVIAAALGLILAVGLAWAFNLTAGGPVRTRNDEPGAATWLSRRTIAAVLVLVSVSVAAGWMIGGTTTSTEDRRTIAVLPFDDFSSDADQAWFALGMQEALTTTLQQIGALQVTSRTSAMKYADTDLAMPEIAAELGTRWLVEGSVMKAGDRIRITAQLIDGSTDQHVWAEDYEDAVEDILALQSRVARAIAGEINVALSPAEADRLESAQPVDPDAFRAYVLGLDRMYEWTPTAFAQAVELLEEAIAIDSTFAPAHARLAIGLGSAAEYGWVTAAEILDRAVHASETALRWDPDASESHHSRASVNFHLTRDWAAAESAFRRALGRNPHSTVYQDFAWMLAHLGRFDEAIPMATEGTIVDPRSPMMRADLGWWLMGSGQYEDAVAEGLRSLEIDPGFSEAHWMLATSSAYLGRRGEALSAMDRYEELYGEAVPYYRAYLLGVLGMEEEARALIPIIEARVDVRQSPVSELAMVHAAIGDRESALAWAEQIERIDIAFMPYLHAVWWSYFEEPRFVAVLERVGLPAPQ